MKFYRRLQPIKAISFDLDDTLYANSPVMKITARAMRDFFAEHLGEHQVYDINFWSTHQKKLLVEQPHLIHDVGVMREETYFYGLKEIGYNEADAKQLAKKAHDCFIFHRSNFTAPQASIKLLADLAKKYPLVSISNGNVDTNLIGLKPYFNHIYHASLSHRQKPCSDMFKETSEVLNIAPENILHVGDCGVADIQGAMLAGFQSAWLPKFGIGKPLKILPHLELSDVEQLRHLLY